MEQITLEGDEGLVAHYRDLLEGEVKERGQEFAGDLQEVAAYMGERAAHLAQAAGEPGFSRAVEAERDNVMLRLGHTVSDTARDTAERIAEVRGIVFSAIRMGAMLLAA
jgi:hypothetical protein